MTMSYHGFPYWLAFVMEIQVAGGTSQRASDVALRYDIEQTVDLLVTLV